MRSNQIVLTAACCAMSACGGTSTVKVSLTDAPIDDAEKVEVTISEVSVHFVPQGQDGKAQAGDEEAAIADLDKPSWHVIINEETTFDLLELKDNPAELGIVELEEGKVTQIRLWLSEETAPTITFNGSTEEMTVSSGKIKLVSEFDIISGEETAITLDFDAAESVRTDGANGYRLHPTIKVVE